MAQGREGRTTVDKVTYAVQLTVLACVALVVYMTLDVLITVRQIKQQVDQIECIPVEVQLIKGSRSHGNLFRYQ